MTEHGTKHYASSLFQVCGTVVAMTEAEKRTNLSSIIVDLRKRNSNWESLIARSLTVAIQVGNRFKPEESGGGSQLSSQQAAIARMHFIDLESALLAKDVAGALQHAEAAYLALG